MLSISLPVLAVEVKLRCSGINNRGDSEVVRFRFDEAARTVDGYGEVDCGNSAGCYSARISDETIILYLYGNGKVVAKSELDRMTGEFIFMFSNSRGKCVPFKQAF